MLSARLSHRRRACAAERAGAGPAPSAGTFPDAKQKRIAELEEAVVKFELYDRWSELTRPGYGSPAYSDVLRYDWSPGYRSIFVTPQDEFKNSEFTLGSSTESKALLLMTRSLGALGSDGRQRKRSHMFLPTFVYKGDFEQGSQVAKSSGVKRCFKQGNKESSDEDVLFFSYASFYNDVLGPVSMTCSDVDAKLLRNAIIRSCPSTSSPAPRIVCS